MTIGIMQGDARSVLVRMEALPRALQSQPPLRPSASYAASALDGFSRFESSDE
jgi:hypothetical protein